MKIENEKFERVYVSRSCEYDLTCEVCWENVADKWAIERTWIDVEFNMDKCTQYFCLKCVGNLTKADDN